jgi:Fic family protein
VIATTAPERRPHGRRIACAGGYRAYVPAPLPPPLVWDDRLIGALSAADRAVGALAGEGRRLPNPQILIRPLVHKEAELSSRIEGTRSTLGELLADEAGAAVDQSPDDLREVANYVLALDYGLRRLETLPLSLRLVREMHERLMRGVRGDVAAPGEFRRTQNWIGPPGCTLNDARYVPPPPAELMPCLDAWETFLHDEALPPLVHAALAHAQFEAIHPFLDGNGRVGRLLITLLLVERAVLPAPLLYLSAHFEATRDEYYARLLGVSERGEWEEWLIYFLRGVALQSQDAMDRIRRIDDLLAGWRRGLAPGRSGVPHRALDHFAENPFWTVPGLARRLGVAFTTAQRALDRLEAAGVVARVGEARRNRLYCAEAVLRALEDPVGGG